MSECVSNKKQSRDRMVAPSRFVDNEVYLAALLFGSISAVVEFGNRFEEYNREVGADARFFRID